MSCPGLSGARVDHDVPRTGLTSAWCVRPFYQFRPRSLGVEALGYVRDRRSRANARESQFD